MNFSKKSNDFSGPYWIHVRVIYMYMLLKMDQNFIYSSIDAKIFKGSTDILLAAVLRYFRFGLD